MKKLRLVLVVCLCASAYAVPGEVHDARVEGAKNSPVNGQWSYRSAEWNAYTSYGDLLNWYGPGDYTSASDQWGFGEHYGAVDPSVAEVRPLFDVDALGNHPGFYAAEGLNDPLDEQVGGHGSYMLRWTADADTAPQIDISGYIYNLNSGVPGRLTNWKILINDVEVADGLTNHSGTTNLWGYDNRLTFADSLTSGSLTINVAPGDIIDIITPPDEVFSQGPPVAVYMQYIITEVPEPATMILLGLGSLAVLRKRR